MIREIDIDLLDLRRDARALNAARVEALADSIARTRLLTPIIVREKMHSGDEGPGHGGGRVPRGSAATFKPALGLDPGGGMKQRYEVIAGAHRLQAHKLLGLAEIACDVVYDDDLHAELVMIDENLIRAELSPAERAGQTARRKLIYDELFPDTVQHVAGGKARQGTAGDNLSFAADTARATGKDPRSVQRDAERGAKVSDKVLDFIRVTPLNTGVFLDRIKNLPPAEQMRVARAELADLGRQNDMRRRARIDAKKAAREQREITLAAQQKALPDAKFGVIYADPEWRFEPYDEVTGMDRAPGYPTSPLAELQARDIAGIAADDCVLFLWATVPMLPEAFAVAEAWGFCRFDRDPDTGHLLIDKSGARYVSNWDWIKDKIITGYWGRGKHEHLLIFTRGKPVAPAMGTQPASALDHPSFGEPGVANASPWKRGEHSAKPDLFAEWIEKLFPQTPKIELNARRARPGWTVWGNEAPEAEVDTGSAVRRRDGENEAPERIASEETSHGGGAGDAAEARNGGIEKRAGDDSEGEAHLAEAAYRWEVKAVEGRRGALTQAEAEPAIRAGYAANVDGNRIAADLGHKVNTIRTWAHRLGLSRPGQQKLTQFRATP